MSPLLCFYSLSAHLTPYHLHLFFCFFLFETGIYVVCGGQLAWQHANGAALHTCARRTSHCVCLGGRGWWLCSVLWLAEPVCHSKTATCDSSSQPAMSPLLTVVRKCLSIAHWPIWITSSALSRARFFSTADLRHTHINTHTHSTSTGWQLAWLFIPSICWAGRYSAFSYHSCFDKCMIEFLSVFVSVFLNMPPRLLFSSHCFCSLWWIICFTGCLFCVIFSTALHICCHFITDTYLTLWACQDAVDKSHCCFVCFPTPEWKEEGGNWSYFSTSSRYFISFFRRAGLFFRKHILSQRESGLKWAGVYTESTVHS